MLELMNCLPTHRKGIWNQGAVLKIKTDLGSNSNSFIEHLLCARHWDPAVKSIVKIHILMEKVDGSVCNE